jgi:hypothetical protein
VRDLRVLILKLSWWKLAEGARAAIVVKSRAKVPADKTYPKKFVAETRENSCAHVGRVLGEAAEPTISLQDECSARS